MFGRKTSHRRSLIKNDLFLACIFLRTSKLTSLFGEFNMEMTDIPFGNFDFSRRYTFIIENSVFPRVYRMTKNVFHKLASSGCFIPSNSGLSCRPSVKSLRLCFGVERKPKWRFLRASLFLIRLTRNVGGSLKSLVLLFHPLENEFILF